MSLKKPSTLILSSLLCMAIAQPVAAGQPPFPNKVISINARGQKIADVITAAEESDRSYKAARNSLIHAVRSGSEEYQ